MNNSDLDFRHIINLLPVYLSIQNRDMEIIFANKIFKRDFNADIGQKCHIAYKSSEDRCEKCPVQRTFQDKKQHFSEETVRTNDGKKCQMLVYSAPIFDDNGNVEYATELAANMTKVKAIHSHLVTQH